MVDALDQSAYCIDSFPNVRDAEAGLEGERLVPGAPGLVDRDLWRPCLLGAGLEDFDARRTDVGPLVVLDQVSQELKVEQVPERRRCPSRLPARSSSQ